MTYIEEKPIVTTIPPLSISEGGAGAVATWSSALRFDELVLSGTTPDEQAQMARPWELFAGAIEIAIAGGRDKWPGLQVVPSAVPRPINWHHPRYGAHYLMRDLADTVPDWGAQYRPNPLDLFADKYVRFVNSVEMPIVDKEAWKQYQTECDNYLDGFLDRKATIEFSLAAKWKSYDERQRQAFPPDRWITMDQWYAQGGNRVLDALAKDESLYLQNIQAYFQRAHSGGQDITMALEALKKNPRVEVVIPSQDGRDAGKRLVWPYSASPSYPDWRDQCLGNPHHSKVSIQIKHDSYQRSYSNTSIGGGLRIWTGFFGIGLGANGSYEKVEVDTRRQGFEMSIDAQIAPISILPGSWFDGAFIPGFKDGPFAKGIVYNHHRAGTLFREGGYFSLRPKQAIVAFRPRITVRVTDQEYHYMRQSVTAQAGLYVGPFRFGGASYSRTDEFVRWDERSTSFTCWDDSPDAAYLLAVDNNILP